MSDDEDDDVSSLLGISELDRVIIIRRVESSVYIFWNRNED
jgi:hypothetical protein